MIRQHLLASRAKAGTALALSLFVCPAIALAQVAPATPAAEAPAAADDGAGEIVVTGSRLAARGFEAPTPVTVIGAQEFRLSGTANVETLLNDTPQFLGSQNNGPTANTVPGGTATLNLRGFGAQRNLVLVNGRRFTITGPDQTTDINTVPAALIERVETVTGGSSAVYGSDAITGVVNFILKNNFDGIELTGGIRADQHTGTPTYNASLTFGTNFSGDRGNIVASFDYLNRGGFSRGDRGGWATPNMADGCVTSASFSETRPGTPLAVPAGQTCLTAGGRPGLIFGGSGTIPNGRFANIPSVGSAQSNPGLDAALVAAGLGGIGGRGFTFNDAGTVARPALTPQDDYDLGPAGYLVIPQRRVALNLMAHYDFSPALTAYAEGNFSNNIVDVQLAPSGIGGNFLVNTNNPYLTPQLREVMRQLDLRETGTTTVTNGTSRLSTTPGDGLAVLNVNRRLPDVGLRTNRSDRTAYRAALGFRGDIGSVSEGFMRNLAYDVYGTYTRTTDTSISTGAASLSKFQAGLLSVNGAAPLLNIFGQNLSAAGAQSIAVASTNYTEADQYVIAANLRGELFDLPAGPVDFNTGAEYRRASANFVPDSFLASGDVSGFNAALPTSGSSAVKELYAELRAPILRDSAFGKRFGINGAVRYSDYNLKGVGSVWTYSVGAEYAPISDITIRGQFQRAIRAPNVGELFGGNTVSGPSATDPCSSRQPLAQQTAAVRAVCVATGVPAAAVFTQNVQPNVFISQVSGGNPNVGPETSNTKTVGVVLAPRFIPGLTASIDYYNINLDGAIAPLGGGISNTLNLCYNVIQSATSEFCQAITRDPLTGQIAAPGFVTTTNGNTGGLKTSGIDFEAGYRVNFDWTLLGDEGSTLDFGTNLNWTNEFTATPVQAIPTIKNNCVGSFGPTCGQPIPEWKGITRVTWKTGPLALSLRHRFIGAVTVDTYVLPTRAGTTAPALDSLTTPRIGTQHYFDLSGSYDFSRKLILTAGIRNLFDRDPPILGSSAPANNTYAATYDIEGRVFYASLTARF
ncbi:TonB-dependent receptor domain-containing protein [Polymorphobacter fuscus]|uniref:TonB-dependent receptor n=1 Tax=Sandarakinorhabdus fusca TaxID=1439888 RepID=A0A7C9GQS2_9SPHN|nr:TonB-dependent receptor [Polymorphobacter fuscus]KAB7644094.1 TonB-dependent receptor [Polymorphobacter fuscus]MQT18477.1 TonB-dependent receptor [Polymorphobacter fuscus]NJC08402.1 outer membrane receptor protein involved in Fe transport [Polymorphobacter fuscus]